MEWQRLELLSKSHNVCLKFVAIKCKSIFKTVCQNFQFTMKILPGEKKNMILYENSSELANREMYCHRVDRDRTYLLGFFLFTHCK